MQNIYGIVTSSGEHIDVSLSAKGAKRYATNHGYSSVSIRYGCGYTVEVLFNKVNGKWVKA